MKRFKLNPDFAKRYCFVALLFAGMGGICDSGVWKNHSRDLERA